MSKIPIADENGLFENDQDIKMSGNGRVKNLKFIEDGEENSKLPEKEKVVPKKGDGKEDEAKKKSKVDETIRTVEISGLKSYMKARSKTAKIFWLVLLLLSTGILIWQFYKTIYNYINSPIVSTYTIKTVQDMEFPIVYLCPTSLSYSEFLNKTPSAAKEALELKEDIGVVWDYVKFLAGGNLSKPFQPSMIDRSEHIFPYAFKDMIKNEANYTEFDSIKDFWHEKGDHRHEDPERFFKNITLSLDKQVRHCEFRSFLFEVLPCENITYEVFDPEYGKCYVVDVGTRKQAVQSQGLVVVFNVWSSQHYPKNSSLTPIFNGVIVGIETSYNVKGSGERLFIRPGTYSRIDLAKQRQTFMSFDHPYRQQCTNDSDFQYQVFNVNYTRQSCEYDCVARALKEKCECLPPIDRRLFKPEVLNETNRFCLGGDLTCIRDKVHSDKAVASKIEECIKQCNIPCNDWRYDVRATSMNLYAPSFDPGQPVPDIAFILVSYSHMEYTQFTQDESTTFDEMIANVGGEVGLWLGASMMTIIQLPLSLITFCGLCCFKHTKKTATVVRERRKSMYPGI